MTGHRFFFALFLAACAAGCQRPETGSAPMPDRLVAAPATGTTQAAGADVTGASEPQPLMEPAPLPPSPPPTPPPPAPGIEGKFGPRVEPWKPVPAEPEAKKTDLTAVQALALIGSEEKYMAFVRTSLKVSSVHVQVNKALADPKFQEDVQAIAKLQYQAKAAIVEILKQEQLSEEEFKRIAEVMGRSPELRVHAEKLGKRMMPDLEQKRKQAASDEPDKKPVAKKKAKKKTSAE